MDLACQEQMLPGDTLLEKWDFARRCGFDAIELRGKGNLSFRDRLPEPRRARAAGVVTPTVCVEMDHYIGGRGAMTPASWGMFSLRLPPFVPPRPPEEDRRRRTAGGGPPEEDRRVLLDALGELGEHAAREGVMLLLEPLNRYEDHMVNRLDQAVELITATGLDSVRVGADTYHMNIEEDAPLESLRLAASWLGHVQVSDSNRLQPGAGHLDWKAIVATLTEIGYDGALAMECRLRGPAAEVLPTVPPLFH